MNRKSMLTAGHRLPESVAHAIRAEAVRQTSTPAELDRAIRWGTYGYECKDRYPYTALARRMYEYGQKLRSDHEFVHRHGPGPLDRLFEGAVDLARAIGSSQGAYRGGID